MVCFYAVLFGAVKGYVFGKYSVKGTQILPSMPASQFFFDTVVRSSCSRNILQPNSLEGPFELNMTNTTSTWWFQIFVIFAASPG